MNHIKKVSVAITPITNRMFHGIGIKKFAICIATKKDPKEAKQPWEKKIKKLGQRNQVLCLQTILQGYSNQNSMVLEHTQKYGSVEQHRKPRDKPMHLGTLIYDKGVNNTQRRKDSLLDKQSGKTGQLHVKEWN